MSFSIRPFARHRRGVCTLRKKALDGRNGVIDIGCADMQMRDEAHAQQTGCQHAPLFQKRQQRRPLAICHIHKHDIGLRRFDRQAGHTLQTTGQALCRRMVVEITEEEAIDYEALERKRNAPGFSGMFALDDYGSGYSNENTLLQLAPRFVKVDITIIRGIDTSPDKQQILRNVVAYAHPRSMKIVAEGVETAAELRTVIELGADLLQGYFLARPAIVPGDIAPEAAGIIQELQRRKKD